MRLLLDTCVFPEQRSEDGAKPVGDLISRTAEESTYVSAVTLGEIARGIALLPSGKRRAAVTSWVEALHVHYHKRILPIDTEVALRWGEISAAAKRRRFHLPVADALISATALVHGLHVATRNERDFVASGVPTINPRLFEA